MPGEMVQSVLYVPLVAGGRASGVISLQNIDRERAFTDSDQQLLETLAGSLSVALENARLVHETRQRNAELALINGVQEAIAGELDSQAIYDAGATRSKRSLTLRPYRSGPSTRRLGSCTTPISSNSASGWRSSRGSRSASRSTY